MTRKIKLIFNPYFHLPFAAWIIAGGLLLLLFSKQWLFAVVNTHHAPLVDHLLYYITFMGQPEIIIPALIALMIIPALRTVWYFLVALVCNTVPLFTQQILKRMFHTPRPVLYFNRAAWIHHLPQWPELLRNSFPSGHSQGAFSFFCFLSLLLPAKYRASGFVFFVFAMAVCYSRIYLAAHFFDDVYAGGLIGGIFTTLLFAVMNSFRPVKKIKGVTSTF